MKSKKRRLVLKEKVQNVLMGIAVILISFIAMSIESIGNPTYNKILAVSLLVLVLIGVVLDKFGREIY